MNKWYFTFGVGNEFLKDKYVLFQGSFNDARKRMFANFGTAWCMQYSEQEFIPIKEKYGLTELKMEGVA